MAEVDIEFPNQGISGVFATGVYIADAARRSGIKPDESCTDTDHFCEVQIAAGSELLSEPTAAERKVLGTMVNENWRLGCQARVDRRGELKVMIEQNEAESAAAETQTAEEYRKQFAAMPLQEKIVDLAQLEAIALGETFSFILNSPYMIFGKIMDVMADFGYQKERTEKDAGRPAEHADEPTVSAPAAEPPRTGDEPFVNEHTD